MRGVAAVAGFVAFGTWFYAAMGGFGEVGTNVAIALFVFVLLVGVFLAFATEDADGH